MTKLKQRKKITYTTANIKYIERSDRIVFNDAWLKGRRNPRRSWHIKLGDTVYILRGDDKGKTGKVIKVLPALAAVIVDGVNICSRHLRKPNQQEGQILKFPKPVPICAVSLFVEIEGKKIPTRIRFNQDGKRIAIKTGKLID